MSQVHHDDGIGARRWPAPFWSYWGATATSKLGAGVTAIALPLMAMATLNASNFEIALLTAASYAAVVLVGLPAGVIVDRYESRRLQVAMDLFRAVAVASIPVAAWWGVLTLGQLLVVAFLVGLASNLFDVANASFLPRIVPKDELIARNGLLSGTAAATQLSGPAFGGVLVQTVGAATGLLLDSFTYIISAILLGRIPPSGGPVATNRAPFARQVVEGLRYVTRHAVIRPSLLAASATNFANGAILAVTAPFLVRTLELPAAAVGLVFAGDGLGSIAGAFLVTKLVRAMGDSRTLLVAAVAGAALALLMPLAMGGAAVVIFMTGLAGFAIASCILSVITRSHRQVASPPELLSRVMASVRFVSWSAIPVGSLCAGGAAQAWGPRAGLMVATAGAVAAAVVLWRSPVRHFRSLVQADEAAEEPQEKRP